MNPQSIWRTGMMALAVAATSLQAQAGADGAGRRNELGLEVVRLSPRVAVVYGGPWDNGIVAVAGQKGLVVVDAPFSKTLGGAFREAIRAELGRADVAYLVNTHEHVCHVGGNGAFADVPIVGHESLLREMRALSADAGRATKVREMGDRELAKVRDHLLKADPKKLEGPEWAAYQKLWRTIQADLRKDPTLVPPTITFESGMTLHLGDVSVELAYYGHSHGVGDTIVRVPEENLVLTAGIFYPTKIPTLDGVAERATPSVVDNWFVVMRRLLAEANDETKFLASHSRVAMKKEQYHGYVDYLEGLWKGVRGARAQGRTLDQAKADLPLKGFPAVAGLPNEELRGTEWENLDIHGHNIERLWTTLDLSPR